jgi:hypothetical protein
MVQQQLPKAQPLLPDLTTGSISDLVEVLKRPLTVHYQKQLNANLQLDNCKYITTLAEVFTRLET